MWTYEINDEVIENISCTPYCSMKALSPMLINIIKTPDLYGNEK